MSKLHLPIGAYTFASRRAYRLGHPCQRESPRDRSITRAFKLKDRLDGEGGIGDWIPKPKWMRWRTYEREIARIEAAERINNSHMWARSPAHEPYPALLGLEAMTGVHPIALARQLLDHAFNVLGQARFERPMR